MPLPKPEFAEPACSSELDDEVIVQRLLEKDAAEAPSSWSATVHSNIVQVVSKMRELFRMLHPAEAATASRAARERIENFRENERRGTPLTTQSRAASAFDYRLTGFEVDDAMRSDREKMGKMAIVGGEKDLDEAIAHLVSKTKYGVRVPTRQIGVEADLPPVKTVKLITEAVHTFEKNLRESVTQTLKDSGADVTKRRTSLKDGKPLKHEGIAAEDVSTSCTHNNPRVAVCLIIPYCSQSWMTIEAYGTEGAHWWGRPPQQSSLKLVNYKRCLPRHCK